MGKKLVASLAVSGLAVVGLLMFATPAYAAASCVWTGTASQNWNNAANWSSCGGGVPQNGDSLTFDMSILNTPSDGLLTNDISGLQVEAINFVGASNFQDYLIGGNAISLHGGIHDTATGPVDNSLDIGLTLTADQTFTTSGLLDVSSGASIDLGTHTLNINGGRIQLGGAVSGSGTLNFNSASTANFIDANSPSFSGPINVNSGRVIFNASTPTALGTGLVTIASGGTLQESFNTSSTYSITNDITMIGDGGGNNGALNLHDFTGGTSTVNFTGAITLTGNASVDLDSANANFVSQPSGCGFTISKSGGSTAGNLTGNLTGSCTVISSSSSGSGTGSSTPSSPTGTPGAPATGYGMPSSQSMAVVILGASSLSLTAGLIIVRRTALHNR